MHDAQTTESASPNGSIRIRGARVHNLQNVDIDLPRDRLIVITGRSGSGKSSLALDTLYAEGQRQYIESLSTYARQFLDQMERPDVDLIDGLQPTLCIDQRSTVQNPRSTVGTITEVYDYLRLLMARLGEPSCYACGAAISQQSAEAIQSSLMDLPEGTKLMILSPLVRGRRGQHREVFAQIRKHGLLRARVNGEILDLEQVPELSARRQHHIDAVVDRVIVRPGVRNRIGESVQLAIRYSEGLVVACYHDPEAANGKGRWIDKVFSTRFSCPSCNVSFEEIEPRLFSFNSPYGACPTCEGLGSIVEFDADLLIPDRSKSLAEGALAAIKGASVATVKKYQRELNDFLVSINVDWETPLDRLKPQGFEKLLRGKGKNFVGLLNLLERECATTKSASRQEVLETFRGRVTCNECHGARVREEARSVRLGGQTIHDITHLSIARCNTFFAELRFDEDNSAIANPIVDEIRRRLDFLNTVGVGYLTLDRSADTLSGGELQRVRLATSIGSGLVGVCYVLDEPSIGLHQRDNERLIKSLRDLQQQGNTVIVVEHDEAIMREADRLVDMGPQAGAEGGQVIAQGTPDEVTADEHSLTGRYLRGELAIATPKRRRRLAKSRSITIEGMTTNNLKDVTARVPLGAFVCVTGVSGSGKSSLVNETLTRALTIRLGSAAPKPGAFSGLRGASQIDKIIEMNQSPIGRSPRSNAVTYTGTFDEIRKVFANTRDAKQRGFKASRFSFNVKGGRCEHCQGQGVQKIEMNFLPDLFVTCPECLGQRFNSQTLAVRYRGKSIADVLAMSVSEATEFFENFSQIHRTLQSLADVGLGYLPLGQSSTSLSGGEAQRIKLAAQLARTETGKTLYVLDEPTTGLHFEDIRCLLDVLNRLVDRGNTVVVIEHQLDVVKCADWIIDLGPEGGEGGGEIVATGTPEEIAALDDNATGRCLAQHMSQGLTQTG